MHEISEFKGNKIIVLKNDPDDKFPFSFGVAKAKKIFENLDAIKDFIAQNDTAK